LFKKLQRHGIVAFSEQVDGAFSQFERRVPLCDSHELLQGARTVGITKGIQDFAFCRFVAGAVIGLGQRECLLEGFSRAHSPTPVTVGGFGSFPPDVIFLHVQLSDEARATFRALIRDLRSLAWMQWDQYDGERLQFHATIAEGCGRNYSRIMEFLEKETQYFHCAFDNITILQQTHAEDGIDKWSIHYTYRLVG
jgi:2'-5' RNA ligase